MNLRYTILLLTITAVLCDNTQAQNKAIHTATFSIDSVIQRMMDESGIVGLGASIIVNKHVVWTKAYGFADVQTKKPFTPQTIMNIGSSTKNITGLCMMKALEEKKLSLDEDINTYLPFKVVNPYFPNNKITLRQLATHSSCLVDRYPFYDSTYNYSGKADEDLGSFLKNYFEPQGKYYSMENFLNHQPGSYYAYANIPAALAGYIVERVMGKTLQELGKEILFKPLGMKHTAWSLQEVDATQHSTLYDKRTDSLKIIARYTFPSYPDGGVRSTVADLSTYFAMILNDGAYKNIRIVKKELVQQMKSFQFSSANKPENMNLEKLNSGLFWATKMGGTRVGHNGSDPGIRVFMLSDRKEEIAVVLFMNTSLADEGTAFRIYENLYRYGQVLKEAASQ